ncbi:MAG: epoxide hydrolase [Actinobacteria bacterium]|uniref:Unannotated protein n=1 Tax=freshwater metagenome TaxID=449393 RepID=A0A6J6NWI0_9ZZZZ|nr:epoxide hydrolase [Actinomycetota bacterium]
MSDPQSVVESFLGHCGADEVEQAVALLDPAIEWRNTGMPTVRGARVAQMLRDMPRRGVGFDVEMKHIAATGSTVLTERTDILTFKRFRMSFWVAGTFEVRDGLIVLWNDHFNWGGFTWAALKGLGATVRR